MRKLINFIFVFNVKKKFKIEINRVVWFRKTLVLSCTGVGNLKYFIILPVKLKRKECEQKNNILRNETQQQS